MKKYFLILLLSIFLLSCHSPNENLLQGATTAPTENITGSSYIMQETAFILGREGFRPMEITINKGDIVIWGNRDPEKKGVVLTFHKEKSNVFFNSELIKPGNNYSHIFNESGEYTYWTTGYGVKGKLKVKE